MQLFIFLNDNIREAGIHLIQLFSFPSVLLFQLFAPQIALNYLIINTLKSIFNTSVLYKLVLWVDLK